MYVRVGTICGFNDSTVEDMIGNRMRERGQQRAAAAGTKPLYMGRCSTNWAKRHQ